MIMDYALTWVAKARMQYWRLIPAVAGMLALVSLLGVRSAKAGQSLSQMAKAQAQNSSSAATSAQATAAAQAARSQAVLAQSAKNLAAMQQAQMAAKSLSISTTSNVLNGLANATLAGQISGLVPDNGINVATTSGAVTTYSISSTWSGVSSLSQTVNASGSTTSTTVTVTQNQADALLNWQSFNIGKSTTLYFDQSAGGADVGTWIAFNKVGNSTSPSLILGNIQAAGQVYIINQNGIIFGGSSQVNTHALVASALPINDNLVANGLANNADLEFLFSSLQSTKGTTSSPLFISPSATPSLVISTVTAGNVIVQPGAVLNSAPIINEKTSQTGSTSSLTLSQLVASGGSLTVSYAISTTSSGTLVPGTDYILSTDSSGKTVINLTSYGITKVAGADISASYTPVSSGGKIVLVGLNVTNSGTITATEGQVILAAGQQVGLYAHSELDSSLRGLDVFIGAANQYGQSSGSVTNNGIIEIPRADVTMAGANVYQLGVIDGSTSVSLNGRVDLLADYNAVQSFNSSSGNYTIFPLSTGGVMLGQGSVTEILPELSSSSTVVGTQLALTSLINIQGKTIEMATNSIILAPSASLPGGTDAVVPVDGTGTALSAGVSFNTGEWAPVGAATYAFVHTDGQVALDQNSVVDVSGSENVNASVLDNIIAVQLLGTELADSPLNRDGTLRDQTIYVDIRDTGTYSGTYWIGTPLANTLGYVGLIQRTVGELTTAGGTVAINAGSSVSMNDSSQINVSGGWINYQGATVNTTKVVSGGIVYDISQATPNHIYDILTNSTQVSAKWGVSNSYNNVLLQGSYEQGYTQGANAGGISVTAPTITLSSGLYGNAVAGVRQRYLTAGATTGTALPQYGSLSLTYQAQTLFNGSYVTYSPSAPNIIFESSSSTVHPGTTVLSTDLVNVDGFANLTVNDSDGNITVPSNVTLTAANGGSISFLASNIDIEGTVTSHGGNLSFGVYDHSPFDYSLSSIPAYNSLSGTFTLGSRAALDASGLIVNDLFDTSSPSVISGGTVTIKSTTATLTNGSSINVSGGVEISSTGKLSYGNAGAITIATGRDLGIPSLLTPNTMSALVLNSNLSGYAGGSGGSLSITAPLVQIGGTSAPADALLLSPDFFSQGGFANFTLTGLGDPANQSTPAVYIMPNTVITPQVESAQVTLGPNGYVMTPTQLVPSLRSSVNLTFSAPVTRDSSSTGNNQLVVRGDFVMGEGASILINPTGLNGGSGGSVSINAGTVAVLGDIIVPGGTISVAGAKSFDASIDETQATPTVDLGPNSVLSTAGEAVSTFNSQGYNTGVVLSGGNITVTGNIVAEAGSVLNVSGATGQFDVQPQTIGQAMSIGSPYVSTRLDSNGGSITLKGSEELLTDATLEGEGGGQTGQGGSLSISSGRFYGKGVVSSPTDITLQVTQGGASIPASYTATGRSVLGSPVNDADGNPVSGGYFTADSFANGGFDSLVLGGVVQFKGDVTIKANSSLIVGSGTGTGTNSLGVIYADSAVNLSAAYIRIGSQFQGPLTPTQLQQDQSLTIQPKSGTGNLTVSGSLIDVGNLTLQNIGNINLIADGNSSAGGSIRGDGTLDIAGNVYMRAGQIYPTTDTIFSVAAYGNNSTVTIDASANPLPLLPLSGGGTLNIYAANIIQSGVLRAPIGVINLGWDGSGTAPFVDPIAGTTETLPTTTHLTLSSGSITSVSAVDPTTGVAITIPYGTNLNGTSWIDPSGTDITASGVPEKAVNISGVNVDVQGATYDSNGVVIKDKATIDVRGGGDLSAFDFVSGTGGTKDILSSSTSFAIIPNYQGNYAPIDMTVDSSGNNPYENSSLHVGDKIYLDGSNGLPAGSYTLLPASYALMPGAYLVTPVSSTPTITSQTQLDGSSFVSGYRYNSLDSSHSGTPVYSTYDVAPLSVVQSRAEYDTYSANSFLSAGATSHDASVPRLPTDSGQLSLASTQAMALLGQVLSQAPAGGLGSQVDISSPSDILIGDSGTNAGSALFLDAANLSSFGADSLLIGGYRTTTTNGVAVTVTTNNLTVNNVNEALTGPDIILVANKTLTVSDSAVIVSTKSSTAETLLLGNSSVAGSGNGALLRVSSDPGAQIIRSGVNSTTTPSMFVGANATVSGSSVILDSTSKTKLDPTAIINGKSISLNTGTITFSLSDPISAPGANDLVISNAVLQSFLGAQNLSLLGYNGINFFGTGDLSGFNSLALHAPAINGDGGNVTVSAKTISLDNNTGDTAPTSVGSSGGSLTFNANTINLGDSSITTGTNTANTVQASHTLAINNYKTVQMEASEGILVSGTGALSVSGALSMVTPEITGATGANQVIVASGALSVTRPSGNPTASVSGGLGAALTFSGSTVNMASNIVLNSGTLNVHATGNGGNVTVSGLLDASGTEKDFYDAQEYTSGGQITLTSDTGSVIVTSNGEVTVAAKSGGGDAGSLTVSAIQGSFSNSGNLLGQSGAGGVGGIFSLDVNALSNTGPLDAQLNSGGFAQSRSYRVRTGGVTVSGVAQSHTYNLSADGGSVTVSGLIDAAGATVTYAGMTYTSTYTTGGTINLYARDNVTLSSGSLLTVAAQNFSDAGKGGAVSLEAGNEIAGVSNSNAIVDIRQGSKIDLSVAAQTATSASDLGQFTGTLHIRAPQNSAGTGFAPGMEIAGTISNASVITVEGYKIYTPSNGIIDTVESTAQSDAQIFAGNSASITDSLLSGNPNNAALASSIVVTPGVEIINTAGDLTLQNDWDLSTFRFGPNSAPGILTLRASGNLIFNGALSDGFTSSAYDATLLTQNTSLPANDQSWSYRLVSGADFSATDFHEVQSLAVLTASNSGSLKLGVNGGTNISNPFGTNATTATALAGHYQVIRTGTGDIDVASGLDVQLLNQFASIYTVGTQVLDPTLGGNFDVPLLYLTVTKVNHSSPTYPAQYSFGGGDVTIAAQRDITHLTLNGQGVLVADSEREMPNNWLYRRGYVNPTTGQFGATVLGDIASTSWWIDFSNFFEGIGALGGGNVTMIAGHDVSNVDGVVPTNMRVTKGTASNPLAANQTAYELGGGDLVVSAGNNIDGGVYYVERGQGTLSAGNTIKTNQTRSPSLTNMTVPATVYPSTTWLPTTLFLGKGSFDVSAKGDLLLGPVANPFLLPQGIDNTYWDKTYFSTYAPTDEVNVASLIGDVTLRESITLPSGAGAVTPLLQAWLQNVDLFISNITSVSTYQPWLRLDETSVVPFSTLVTLMPASLSVTAYSGDIDTVGNITLSPSPIGTINLFAGGSINALQIDGVTSTNTVNTNGWNSSTINLSDADPAKIPAVNSPYAYQVIAGTNLATAKTSIGNFSFINNLFMESGSTEGTYGVLQTKEQLHANVLDQEGQYEVLHYDDSTPVHIYAQDGNISGLTLFSGKLTDVIAGNDITDVALYIQNDRSTDVSQVVAGRDIVAYDANSLLRVAANASGNSLDVGNTALSGDIQISGPGTLEVLAGRNLDMGAGPANSDGTGVGITSIGNERNPYLPNPNQPSASADIIAGAGIGGSSGLDESKMNFGAVTFSGGVYTVADQSSFIAQFLCPTTGGDQATRYLSDLGTLMGLPTTSSSNSVWSTFAQLPQERQDQLALDVFYLVLRDAGRDHGKSTTEGSYQAGYAAIAALFPATQTWSGNISLTSREIKTVNGGDISLFAPGGSLTVGIDAGGKQPIDQGIFTAHGGNINIFTDKSVIVGTSRIFTLRGGNEIIWSTEGDIAAGASSKTVQSAPPTRVLIDPQSADVETDLSGLATGGGIGVLETVAGIPPGDVDLVAPTGAVDAGDAGIRASGNLNIAAQRVLNTFNIQGGGSVTGVPVVAVSTPNLGAVTSAQNNSSTTGATAAAEAAQKSRAAQNEAQDVPSIITVEVIGYGGDDSDSVQ